MQTSPLKAQGPCALCPDPVPFAGITGVGNVREGADALPHGPTHVDFDRKNLARH